MTEEEKTFSKILQDARIKTMRIISIFRELKGTFKNMSFTTKNLDNLKKKKRTKSMDTDIDATVKYLKKLQLENVGIDYTMRFDDQNTMKSIFWTGARGKMDYQLYRDFVSFDTTFSTNMYNMPFAPIVGIMPVVFIHCPYSNPHSPQMGRVWVENNYPLKKWGG
jgi:hypothetical protein